jgi:hypothetical protein
LEKAVSSYVRAFVEQLLEEELEASGVMSAARSRAAAAMVTDRGTKYPPSSMPPT